MTKSTAIISQNLKKNSNRMNFIKENYSKCEKRKFRMEEPQITSCFPNDNTKRIDYVIFYKYSEQSVDSEDFKLKETNRNNFLDAVQKESIILNKELKFKTKNETNHYILLHCPLERLLKQAERIKLEMRLKDAKLDDPELINYEIKWIRAVKDFILRRKPIRKDDLEPTFLSLSVVDELFSLILNVTVNFYNELANN
ncbi:hypothetical protein BpHYR1_031974 [Brachionus plicatilis]|uniref:Anoctamin dimerisation domain-containing protein n=1 Tax=Brachionus plicatilis TaxID=10195 RepID=A0A3M7SPM2_BRAPC|nr:hypothetical protein BpHYR1_031974 [Brachionus plicatilis]